MNKEEPYRDQAERLKQRIQKINEKVDEYGDELPPREQVHRQKKNKTKWKLRFPVIRLLVVCFILLPIIIFSVISYRDNGKKIMGSEKANTGSVGYEMINLKNNENDDNNIESKKLEEGKQVDSNVRSTEEEGEDPVLGETPNQNNQTNTPSQPSSTINPVSPDQQQTDKNSGTPRETKKTETTTKIKYHKVKPGEGLYRISMYYYHSQKGIEIIKKANNLTSENLYAGQVLKIPLNN